MTLSMQKVLSQICIFSLLFMVTNFVNKYVLSILEFKYPTIFQGWQTFVGFVVLRMAVVSRQLPAMVAEEPKRKEAVKWIPGMVLFVITIYSGSKALANLPIPVFLSLQNLVSVMSCTAQMALTRKLMSVYSYSMLMLVTLSSVGIVYSDPEFQKDGYFWMCIHILSTGILQIYTKLTKGRLKLSSHERLYCSYIYSIIVLAPSSYLIGDALEAIKFPYLYFSKFYIGCMFSGVFGVLLNLYTIRLQEIYTETIDFVRMQGLTKIICSIASLGIFDMTLTHNHGMWLVVNQLAGMVCEDPMLPSVTNRTNQEALLNEQSSLNSSFNDKDEQTVNGGVQYDVEYVSIPISKTKTSSFTDPLYSPARLSVGSKHNVLYEDYLKDGADDGIV